MVNIFVRKCKIITECFCIIRIDLKFVTIILHRNTIPLVRDSYRNVLFNNTFKSLRKSILFNNSISSKIFQIRTIDTSRIEVYRTILKFTVSMAFDMYPISFCAEIFLLKRETNRILLLFT